MVRLVEKNAALPPGALFVAPIRVFGGDYGIDISSDPRITEQVHRISDIL
jgi:hypothetical protein